MADGWTHSVVCRYFKNGVCREGNNCRYRHVQGNRNDANVNNMETMSNRLPSLNVTCRFFKQGVCKFGNQCHFRHNTNILDTNTTQINMVENATSGHNASSSKNKKDDKRTAEEWVKAPEFMPTVVPPVAGSSFSADEMSISGTSPSTSTPISYAQTVNPSGPASVLGVQSINNNPILETLNIIQKDIKDLKQKNSSQEIEIKNLKKEVKNLHVRVDGIELGNFAQKLKIKIINTLCKDMKETNRPSTICEIEKCLTTNIEKEDYKRFIDELKISGTSITEVEKCIKILINQRNIFAHPKTEFNWNTFEIRKAFPHSDH